MTKQFTLNAHERINTNDCYLKFKHQYELVTNLDLDEIIFPRQKNVMTSFELNNMSRVDSPNYNIYNYAKKFFKNENVSSIEFQHVLMIQNYTKLVNSLKSPDDDFLFSNETNKNYLKLIQKRIQTIEAGNKISYWQVPYGFYLSFRRGKSIHNTDLVEGINQHYASVLKLSSSSSVLIPLSSGFVSHFREIELPELYTQDYYRLKNFLIDLEYFYYTINFNF